MPDTILLVEDDDAVRALVEWHLTEAGFIVIAVAGAIAALQQLDEDQPINLLLTDVYLPGGPHGVSLAHMTKVRRGIPVIFITGHRDLVVRPDALPGKVFGKPVKLAELTAEIRRQLSAAGKPPPQLDESPERVRRWRMKAEELRTAADGYGNNSARRDLRQAAETYDTLADHAEARHERANAGNKDREPEVG